MTEWTGPSRSATPGRAGLGEPRQDDASPAPALITVTNLSKVYLLPESKAKALLPERGKAAVEEAGGFLAVDDVSFKVRRGEIFAIMGLSGSGKSTVIRMLNRLIEPTAGEICIDGDDVGAMSPAALRELRNKKINMVFQHFALLPHRSLADNVSYGLKVRGVDKKERRTRALAALDQVGLADRADVLPSALSGGMRQRVGLARALATDAEILLMDEPFSALDPLIRKDMQNLLLQLQQEFHKTIVFVTHDLNEAMRIGDHIMIMKQGSCVQLDDGPGLLSRPADDYVTDFIADVDKPKVLRVRDAMEQPTLTLTDTTDPEHALLQAKDSGVDGAQVVDRDGRLRGSVTVEALRESSSRGHRDVISCLDPDCHAISESASLYEVIPQVAGEPLPVAVVDAHHRLVGVLSATVLLNALGPTTEVLTHA